MKKETFKYVLLAIILVSAFLGWLSVYRAITVAGASPWLVPIIWFSFFIISLCLATVVLREFMLVEIAAAVAFLFSLVFARNLWHFAITILCILFLLSAMHRIRKDLDLNIKISLWKSLFTGKSRMVFATILLISSQYFFIIRNDNGPLVIPKLDLAPATQKLVGPVLGIMNPDFKQIQQDDITVDQFIIKTQQNSDSEQSLGMDISSDEFIDSQIPQGLPQAQKDEMKNVAKQKISDAQAQISQKNNELVLSEGRKQLSQLIGRDVQGNEKIADVFSGLVDKKINDYFQPQIQGDQKSSAYPFILTFILFLTILSLGVLLSNLWFAVVIGLFNLCVRLGIVEIKKVMVERETIA